LREKKGLDTRTLPTYDHKFEDGRVVAAKLYPNSVLADFRQHFNEEWMPGRAIKYFEEKDPTALPHLRKLLPSVKFKHMVE
jgi:hypothetical protein